MFAVFLPVIYWFLQMLMLNALEVVPAIKWRRRVILIYATENPTSVC
jgi:hypothetical protein